MSGDVQPRKRKDKRKKRGKCGRRTNHKSFAIKSFQLFSKHTRTLTLTLTHMHT